MHVCIRKQLQQNSESVDVDFDVIRRRLRCVVGDDIVREHDSGYE